MVEITGGRNVAFSMFSDERYSVQDYLERVVRCDTTILHMLLGTGVEEHIFRRVFYRTKRMSARTIIVELNAESREQFPGMEDFHRVHVEWLLKFIPSYTRLEFCGGLRFDDSFVVMVVDQEH